MKKTQKILLVVLCVFALAAILGITWMTASRVTSAQIYGELQAMPVTNKTSEISAYLDRFFIDDYDEETLDAIFRHEWSQQRATVGAII